MSAKTQATLLSAVMLSLIAGGAILLEASEQTDEPTVAAARRERSPTGSAGREVTASRAAEPAQARPVSLEKWRGEFTFEAQELPAVVRESGVVVFDQLEPNGSEQIRNHLERNYLGTLDWIESQRGQKLTPQQARRQAIELARDQAKLEYFERGLYWLVASAPGTQIPATGFFRHEGHDVTFVKSVLDDDGIHKFVITYVSHRHPMMEEALGL